MYKSRRLRYTAIHLRLGGLTGEKDIPFVRGGGNPFDNFLAAATCANRLRVHYNMDLPILVVTDNHKLREMLQDHKFPGLVSAGGRPVHLDRGITTSIEDHQSTIVDMIMLAQAECLVTTPSGFSHHAWLAGGGKPCQRMFYNCSDLFGGPGGGPDDQLMQRLPD